jgi:hypothetical protein
MQRADCCLATSLGHGQNVELGFAVGNALPITSIGADSGGVEQIERVAAEPTDS